jgi:EAL domain-containing protein (putative c-di-GMP-specific phosphodiesterase class I)
MGAGAEGNGSGDERIARELAIAIAEQRLNLYFQPIVSLQDRSATMLEALPRWAHPELGILAPADFIDVAAEEGLLGELERWAIEAAFVQLAVWRSGVASELTISLNLSEEHLFETDLAEAVRDSASASGASAHRIGFEITERALLAAGGRSLGKLRDLSDLGVSLTIDDCNGSDSAELVRELPTTALKISRWVVEGIPDDEGRVELASATIELGRELGLATIASGVESPGQLASLRDLGCRYAQGFLLSVPMPAEVLEDRMPRR